MTWIALKMKDRNTCIGRPFLYNGLKGVGRTRFVTCEALPPSLSWQEQRKAEKTDVHAWLT